jgi:hypothetical protein
MSGAHRDLAQGEWKGATVLRFSRLQRDTTGADACRLRLRTYSISRLNATLT